MRRIKRKKEERIRQLILAGFFTAASVIILAAVIVLFKNVFQKKQVDPGEVQVPEYVKVDLLTPNPYSRPQKPLEEVRGIVVHYVANPCSTARENRSYFEQLKDQTGENATSASSHFVIGLEGEVVQCGFPLRRWPMRPTTETAIPFPLSAAIPMRRGSFTTVHMSPWWSCVRIFVRNLS